MHAGRTWLVISAAFLAGCTTSPEEHASTPPVASALDEDYLAGIVTAAPPDTPETLAQKRAQLEANLKLAEECAERGEPDRAIQLLEDAVMFDAEHRTVLLLLTQHLYGQSVALERDDPRRSYQRLRQSGGYLRMLRDAHRDFSADEQKLFVNVLFDEARAYARANRQEDFAGSLSAAIDAGFNDLGRLRSEPDLEQFRSDEKMSAVIKDAERRIEERTSERSQQSEAVQVCGQPQIYPACEPFRTSPARMPGCRGADCRASLLTGLCSRSLPFRSPEGCTRAPTIGKASVDTNGAVT